MLTQKPTIAVLTGAGISAESGLQTFRDSDGLWNGYNVHEVATPEGFKANPQLVLDFYNHRRKEVLQATPNNAHLLLAQLEKYYNVIIITQNIDDLHERAGSTQVLHLHGEIFKMRSIADYNKHYSITGDINIGDIAEDGFQLRPHIVWFGEAVPLIALAETLVQQADIFIIIGTSLQVYPAAGLLQHVNHSAEIYVVDKAIPSSAFSRKTKFITQPATIGMQLLYDTLTKA